MKTVNSWFSESIEQYKKLTAETLSLKENVLTLPLSEIMERCASIKELQASFNDREEQLHQIMTFVGSDILENPLIGKYQDALDLAIRETDLLAAQTRRRKELLMQEIEKAQATTKVSASFHTGMKEYSHSAQSSNQY